MIEFVPRVFARPTLDTMLETMALGTSERRRLASRTDLTVDVVDEYLDWARWLGFVDSESIVLTETGRRYVGDLDSRRDVLRRATTSTPLICRARAEEAWPEQPDRAIARVLERDTDLPPPELRGRAEGLAELLEQLGVPSRQRTPEGSTIRSALPDPAAMPLAILGPPETAEAALDTLGIETIGDLLALEDAELERWNDETHEALESLREAGWDFVERESEELIELAGRLLQADVDLEADWREVFVQLPTRAESGLAALGLETTGEVVTAVVRGDLTNLTGIGPGTVRSVREQFDVVIEHGYDYYLYGPGGRPETVSELADRMLDSLSEEDRTILEMRYLEGQTFEEIGETFELTRQRIRQKTQDYLETLDSKYGDVAEELTRSLLEALDDGPGLVHRERVEALTGCSDLYRVLLTILLNDEDAYLWHDHFIADVPSSTLDRGVIARCRRGISNSRSMRVSVDDGIRIVRDVGLDLDRRGIADLLRAVWDLEIDARGTFLNRWTNKGDRIARVLEEARRPLDLATIAERYQQRYATDAEAEATPRRVQPFVKKHPDVYTIDNGEYVHVAALPLREDFLERVVDWCVERLRGETSAVSVKVLLEHMKNSELALESYLEGLNWYLLRDTLLRHPDITGFHNTFNVAWEPTYEYEGVTLLDRVETLLEEADGPITAEEVVEALPEDFEVNPHSVENYLVSEPFSIKIDAHTYLHRDGLPLDDEAIERLVDLAVAAIPEDGSVTSTARLVDDLEHRDGFEPLFERDDADAILWGLLRHDDRVQVGTRLLVARDGGSHEVLLERAILDTVERIGPAYPREIDEALDAKFGFDVPDSRVYRHARELADQQKLRRFPNGLYFAVGLDESELFDVLESRHEELTRAARRADIARYPTDDLGMLAGYLAYADQFEAAERVLDVLRHKEPADVFEERHGDLHDRVRREIDGSRGPTGRQSAE
jgi:hypothetical protein